jgi:Ca-activated chloride channel family protein
MSTPHRIAAVVAAGALAAACGGGADAPSSAAASPVTADRPRPGPGADLDGPIPQPDRSAVRRRAGAVAQPLDLGDDRAYVDVTVPRPPRGGAVGFDFGDERKGWVTRLPEGRQLPAVAYGDGRVYVSGGFDSVSFYGLNATTGTVEWATTNLEDNGPTAAIYEDDRVIFNTESCTLFALDASTGKRLWFEYLGDPTLAQIAVADGIVYSAHPSPDGHRLSAFRTRTGAKVWSRRISHELLATPVIHGDAVYASTLDGNTYRFDRRKGKRAWRKRLRSTTAPWPAGDELFLSRRHDGTEQQIVVSAATGDIVREHHATGGDYLRDVPTNLNDWPKVWAFEGSRPVVAGGVRYDAMGGQVRASDAQTGAELWVRRYAGREDERSIGTVALAGPQVVIATRQGQLIGLDIDTGYTLWAYDVGHDIVAEPVIAKGWVYATTVKGYVIALHVGDETLDGWHMFGGNPKHNGPAMAAGS